MMMNLIDVSYSIAQNIQYHLTLILRNQYLSLNINDPNPRIIRKFRGNVIMGAGYSDIYPETVIVGDEGKPNESPLFRNSRVIRENGGQLIATFRSQPEADTPIKLLRGSVIKYGDKDCLGEREYLGPNNWGKFNFFSYKAFGEKVNNFSKALVDIGVKPGDKVGIYSHNCPYWQITSYGCHASNIVLVPVYDSLGPNAAKFIIENAECVAVVVHKVKLESLIAILGELPLLKYIIVIDKEKPDVSAYPDKQSFTCDEIVEMGSKSNTTLVEGNPDDLAVLMYTSGSTGKPKGCMLTHRNVIAGATGLASLGCSITTSDVFLSFLPLAHIYEMGVEYIMISQGASIGFSTGDTRNLTKDLAALKPTIITGVPRVWNKIADTMKAKIEEMPKLKKWFVKGAMALKADAVSKGKKQSLILDMLIFSKFLEVLGGRVRLIVSGGAPILPDIYEFLKVALTPNIVQGYGLTEVAAGLAVQEIPARTASDTGCVSIVSECKFRAVEGLEYDPRGKDGHPMCGELLVRGPHVFKGYYKDEVGLTAEVLDEEGWFATGDIVQLTPHGVIQIIDRAKQLVKLSQGEYISVTTLNDAFSRAEGVASIYLYADSHHDFPAAVVVPTAALVKEWAAAGITDPANSRVAKDQLVRNLADLAEKEKMRGFEKIKCVVIELEEFSVENGLLTPSMKPQWQALRKRYECKLLEEMNDYITRMQQQQQQK